MAIQFEWTPPGSYAPAGAVAFTDGSVSSGQSYSLMLETFEGIGSNFAQAQIKKAPYQTGGTLVGVTVDPRVISIGLIITATTPTELQNVRRLLTAKLGMAVTQLGQTPRLGTLTYTNHSGERFLIKAIPTNSPQFIETGLPTAVRADIEFLCPDPYWQAPSEQSFVVAAGSSVSVTNQGDAPAPVRIVTTDIADSPYFTNATTGEVIGLSGSVGATEINTEFGKKSVTTNGSSAMHRVHLARNRFWYLQPGTQSISCTHSGAWFYYTPRYYGV